MKHHYETSGQFDYKFEELQIDDSGNIFDGSCVVVWEYDRGDSSVGINSGFTYHVENISIEIPVGHPWVVPETLPLYTAIAKSLEDDSHVYALIEKDAEPGW